VAVVLRYSVKPFLGADRDNKVKALAIAVDGLQVPFAIAEVLVTADDRLSPGPSGVPS
jgi:hypothetical protein